MRIAQSRKAVALLIGAALALALGFGACGGDEEGADTGSQSAGGASAPAQEEGRGGEEGDAGKGGSESAGSGQGGGAQRQTPELSEDEQDAKQTAERFYSLFGAGEDVDGEEFCDLLTEEAQKQLTRLAEAAPEAEKGAGCAEAISSLASRSQGFQEGQEPKVVGVQVKGDRATASIRIGNSPPSGVPLVKQDGEWKIGLTAPAGGR